MSIKTFVESVVQQITIQGQAYNFAHGEKDWQNIFADEQSYPVVYLDEPISNDFDVVSSGAIEEYYPIKLMFLYKTELEFTPTQHDNEIQKARLGARKFITLCNQSEDVRTIKNAKGIEVINVFDANTSGIVLSLDISFYNQDPICADFDPSIGFVNLSNSNDSWQHQQINNSNYIVPNTIFEIFDQNEISYGEYSVPSVNGGQVIITVNPCDIARFQNSDGSFIQEIASSETFTSDDIRVYVYDQNENLLGTVDSPSNINVTAVVEIPPNEVNAEVINSLDEIVTTALLTPTNNRILAPDGISTIKKSDGTTIESVNIPSNKNVPTTIIDSVVTLKDSGGANISVTNVKATESKNITAPDGGITVNGSSVGSVKSNGSRALLVKLNGTNSGTFDGVDTINVTSPTPIGGQLLATNQTTSYATGDDGDNEASRNFFVLPHNNPFGNTNRFTDVLGGQTYTNGVVLDWSTWNGVDGSTLIGYKKTLRANGINWSTAISEANALNFGGFASGWHICNLREYYNLYNYALPSNTPLNYAPFSLTPILLWTSQTPIDGTTSAYYMTNIGSHSSQVKTATSFNSYIARRYYTINGTTLS